MFEEKSDQNPTELGKLGEFGLIKHLTDKIELKNKSSVRGVGDDAAVIDYKDKQTVVTTDMLVEGVHFNLLYTPLKHLGYKAVTVNLSDIYAMNAQPKQITVSFAVSNRMSIEALEEIYRGVYMACEVYGVDLVGGDTTSSLSGLNISVTALGEASKDELVYRSGAKENDIVMVSGDLGAAFCGLHILEREKEVFKDNPQVQPDLEGHDYILERQLKPEARKDVIQALKEEGVKPSSMIDVSDGLSSDMLHICHASDIGCEIYEEKLPIDPTTVTTAEEFSLHPATCALSGGEDYELLFTVSPQDFKKIEKNRRWMPVGYITDKSSGYNFIAKGDTVHELKAQGWDSILNK